MKLTKGLKTQIEITTNKSKNNLFTTYNLYVLGSFLSKWTLCNFYKIGEKYMRCSKNLFQYYITISIFKLYRIQCETNNPIAN